MAHVKAADKFGFRCENENPTFKRVCVTLPPLTEKRKKLAVKRCKKRKLKQTQLGVIENNNSREKAQKVQRRAFIILHNYPVLTGPEAEEPPPGWWC